MQPSIESRNAAIQRKQTDQLFSRLKYSAWGTIVVACTMVWLIGPRSNLHRAWLWLLILSLVSLYRWFIAVIFTRQAEDARDYRFWRKHFDTGTYLAASTWSLSMWMFFPQDYPEYQVLMLLGLAGIAGGAVPVLAYDKVLIRNFLLIVLAGIVSQLLFEGSELSLQLTLLTIMYFLFLAKGGRDFGESFSELLALRHDTENLNLTLLSTTERIARIGYWQWDMRSERIELSVNLQSMCGADNRWVDLQSCFDKVHEDDRQRVQLAVDNTCRTGLENSVEYRFCNQQHGDWIIMNQVIKRIEDNTGKQSILGTVQDISIIKSAEQKIFDMAYFDELTGLANRGHFRQQLIDRIKYTARNKRELALLYIDLDSFKEINDSLGHDKGDEYLKAFSQQLKRVVREEDFIARLGGDEFCMILGDINEGMSSVNTAERCLALREQPIPIDHQHFTPLMSIGIAIYPRDGTDVDTLLRAADAAMYSAKNQGKHCFAFYDKQMTVDAARRLQLEADLQQALKKEEFTLVYQPKVSLADGYLTGVEALLRWHHPVRGTVPPDTFISTAERMGLIGSIGEWVMVTACRQLQHWKKLGLDLEMAINISSNHFSAPGFVDTLVRVMRDHGIEAGELEIEITESMSRNPELHIEVCRQLHENGIKVAIDDFGTGYSSLSVLQQLEVDTLKVDRSFVQHLPNDETSVMMVSSIVKMAMGLGFDIVAEGVETAEQADFLKALGCAYVQGYYFSRPVEAAQISLFTRETLPLNKV